MNPIKTKFVLTQEAFDLLLRWLDPDDRDRAGQRYEEIRQSIIRNFARRGSPVAEELADEVMNRVAKRLPEIIDSYDG
ncbi:MAG TPA: hypothetical protein VLZ81_09415, partial [Blastocatellia bacterium]|nr:hypothetical protein [Blastocatellia bacterium]